MGSVQDTRGKLSFHAWLVIQHNAGRDNSYYWPLAHYVLDPTPNSMFRDVTSLQAQGNPKVPDLSPDLVVGRIKSFHAQRALPGQMSNPDFADWLVLAAEQAKESYASDPRSLSQMHDPARPPVYSDIPHPLTFLTPGGISDTISRRFVEEGILPAATSGLPNITGLMPVKCHAGRMDPDSGKLYKKTIMGSPCSKKAVPGDIFCSVHGGKMLQDEELALVHDAARRKLVAATEDAVDITIDIMHNSANDETRRKAAEMILDRTGFAAKTEIRIGAAVEETDDVTQIIRARLERLVPITETQESASEAVSGSSEEEDVVDAELVD